MIWWAQNTLTGAWGLPGTQPLHRYPGKARQQANRRAICGDGVWPNPLIPNDSCDEYAFAATYESGALHGLTGKDCAEVEPVQQNDGSWSVDYIRAVSPSDGCVTGHVDSDDNQNLGRALGTFIVQNRVLDNDPYWVVITQ